MSRGKPSITRLGELEPGQTADFFALLAERTRGQTREGKPYFVCRFRDAQRSATFMVWQDGGLFDACQNEWREGHCYKLRAAYGEHERYGPQLDLKQIRPATDEDRADGFDPLDFVERSQFDPAAMFTQLRELIDTHISDEPLKRLVGGLLDTHRERLLMLPATLRHYHPFAGGWLEHTLNVARNCLHLGQRYREHFPALEPPLNLDVLLAAAALHEMGRVRELDTAVPPQPTIDGRLIGPLLLARDLVRDAAREQGDLNGEYLRLLDHLMITHLNLPEWGSPRLPLVPEALILFHVKDLDAKLEMYARCLMRDRTDGPFTDRDPVLNRQLFKGRSV